MLDRKMDSRGKRWRQIYKVSAHHVWKMTEALKIFAFCAKTGSENVSMWARDNRNIFSLLQIFHCVDQDGIDQGAKGKILSGIQMTIGS